MTDNLDAVVARLNTAGYTIGKPGATEPFLKNVYFVDPARFEVASVEYPCDIPAEQNLDQDAH